MRFGRAWSADVASPRPTPAQRRVLEALAQDNAEIVTSKPQHPRGYWIWRGTKCAGVCPRNVLIQLAAKKWIEQFNAPATPELRVGYYRLTAAGRAALGEEETTSP